MKPIRQFIILILAILTTLASAQETSQFQSAVASFQQSATALPLRSAIGAPSL